MMVSFNVPAKIVDQEGDVLWTEIKIQPSDDPTEDWLDFSLPDDVVLASGCNLMFGDPDELVHALNLAVAERKAFIAEVAA